MVEIKRENWKGKLRIVARENGKLVTWRKWTPKFPISKAKRIFKRNRTFKKNIKVDILTNVKEVTDFSEKPRITGTMRYQSVAKADFKDRVITARSMQHDLDFPRDSADDEALENLKFRIAESFGLTYEEEEGQSVIEEKNPTISLGVVYYRPKKMAVA